MGRDYDYEAEIEEIQEGLDSPHKRVKFLDKEIATYYGAIFFGYNFPAYFDRINYLQRIKESILDIDSRVE